MTATERTAPKPPVKPFVYKPKVSPREKTAMMLTRVAMVATLIALSVACWMVFSAGGSAGRYDCRSTTGTGGNSLMSFGNCSLSGATARDTGSARWIR